MNALAMERIKIGITAGMAAVLVYATFFFVNYPAWAGVIVVSVFGMALGVGCIGLREFMHLHERTFAADLGAVFGVLAGVTVMQMLIVQVAIRNPTVITPDLTGDPDAFVRALDRVHFGLDIAWDMLICTALVFFAVVAARHPRLGWFYAVPGVAIAVGVVVLNLSTFPIPPAGAGSVDLGPAVGLWFLAASIRAFTSLGWARHQLESG